MTIEQTPITRKTLELCQTILEQPNIKSIRERIEAFTADETTRAHYDGLVKRGEVLQQKQQLSTPLTGEEIADFEQHREALLNNPVARGYLDAQGELHEIKHSVHQYLNKTLELLRLPTAEEVSGNVCGHGGCGCGH